MLEEHYEQEPNTGCWLWLGNIRSYDGYPIIHGTLAHRFIFRFIKKISIDNKILHHTCKTKLCVNPNHLQLLQTQGEHNKLHAKDKKAKRTLTQEIEQQVIILANEGYTTRLIGVKLGIAQNSASLILRRNKINIPNRRNTKCK